MPLRRAGVVFNGRAGALLDREQGVEDVIRMFAGHGLAAIFVDDDAGTLPKRIELAAERGDGLVVVAGGDGTVACAASVLAGTDTVLGILPAGTMNLLSKDLGLPIDDMEAAVSLLATGQARSIDVGAVGEHVFLCASMLGLPVKIGRHREKQRGDGAVWRRWGRFAQASVRTVRHYFAPRLFIELDGRTIVSRAPSVTVVVNRLDDASSRLFARGRLDGGEFGVYLARRPRLSEVVPLAIDLVRGRWQAGGVVEEHRATAVTIRTRRRALRVMNDGEATIVPVPAAYKLRRAALQVMAPRLTDPGDPV